MEFRLVSRRLLLIGTPVVLASLMIVHQLIDQFERPVAFLALHLILLPLFALMGVAIWALLEGVGGAVAWAARVAAFLFLVGYVALDAISGIAASGNLAIATLHISVHPSEDLLPSRSVACCAAWK